MHSILNAVIYNSLVLFNSNIKKVSNTHYILKYLLLMAISKKLGEKKALLNYFDKSEIQDFDNA